MKKQIILALSLALLSQTPAFAKGKRREISGKTVVGSLLSLIVWPGIGQAMNDQKGDKVRVCG